jgi:hypothetical protein
MNIRNSLLNLTAILLVLGWPLTAMAHVHTEKTQPADGQTVEQSTKTVEAWFSGKVSAEWSKIEVSDAAGNRVDTGEVSNGDDPNHLSVGLKPLTSGSYSVELNVISGDGHRVKGHFAFNVR